MFVAGGGRRAVLSGATASRPFTRVAAVSAEPAQPSAVGFERFAFRTLPLACLLLLSLAAIIGGSGWTSRWAALPWIVSLVFVGLPHGAADLAVTRRLCGRASTVRIFAIYVACMAAVLAAFLLAPGLLVVLFTGLSIWHFGLAHADGQSPSIDRRWDAQATAAIGRGAAVLGVPLAAWPVETAAVAADLLHMARSAGLSAVATPARFDPSMIRTTGFGLLAAAAAAVAVEAVAGRRVPAARRRSADTLVDLLVIGLLGALASPLFAVGAYFLVWHSWRHMRSLAPVVAGVQPADAPSLRLALFRIHLAALPLLVPTWGALLACWWVVSPGHTLHDLAILSLAVYLVVTPSHDLLIDLLRSRTATDPPASRHSPTVPRSCAARSACCPS